MVSEKTDYAYDLFISYRRADALRLAKYIRHRLQRTHLRDDLLNRLPNSLRVNAERELRIYIDVAYERAATDFLTQKVIPALNASRRLLVISTPAAFEDIVDHTGARSPNWLCQEVDYFFSTRPDTAAENLMVVLGPGAPTDRFPGRLNDNPRWDWVDLRRFGWKTWMNGASDLGLAKLIAAIRDVPESLLPEIQQEERGRRKRITMGIGAAGVCTAVVTGGMAMLAHREQLVAEQQTLVARSRQLASQAISQIGRDYQLALLFAVSANRIAPTYEARDSLQKVLTSQPQLRTFLTLDHDIPMSGEFSRDGKTLVSASLREIAVFWDVARGLRSGEAFKGPQLYVFDAALSPDGKTLATADSDSSVRLWNVELRIPIHSPLSGHTDQVMRVVFSPDGNILASASKDKTVILWDVATGLLLGRLRCGGSIWGLAFSPDGKVLASAGEDQSVTLWDVAHRKVLGEPLKGHKALVTSVAFSPDGKTLATASEDRTVILWDVALRKPVGEPLTGHHARVSSVTFSPDGKTLASAGWDQTVILWNVAHRVAIGEPLKAHHGGLLWVAFSPDGKTLASASEDQRIIFWDVARHVALGEPLVGHRGQVTSVAFSPVGRTLASASWDWKVMLWDLTRPVPVGQTPEGHKGPVSSVAFSPDGRILASASWDQSLIFWSIAHHLPLAEPLRSQGYWPWRVAFSRDGKTLASGGTQVVSSFGTWRAVIRWARHLRAIFIR
ncbi:WD40 repeat domain-containing protein [Paraburkholderia terrae]